jgi:hypothetical protein
MSWLDAAGSINFLADPENKSQQRIAVRNPKNLIPR